MKALVFTLVALALAAFIVAQERSRPLAIEQFEPAGGAILVSSDAFSLNGAIPSKHADYGEKVSPNLSWTGVPASAKSVVVLAEDPDASEPKPFVHWVLYNLPTSFTALPEAVSGTARLPEVVRFRVATAEAPSDISDRVPRKVIRCIITIFRSSRWTHS